MSIQLLHLSSLALTGTCVVVGVVVLYQSTASKIRKWFIEETTALFDLPNAGVSRSGERIKGTAVVCGGSFAGLFAARVCADHFEDVLIVEPEAWLATDGTSCRYNEDGQRRGNIPLHVRTRVMQYDKPHSVLPFFFSALLRLNPDAKNELLKSSARILPAWQDVRYKGKPVNQKFPHRYANNNYPLSAYASRPCMESMTRKLLYQSDGRIRWITGTVSDFVFSNSEKEKIEYLNVRTSDSTIKIAPSLVVDCTGRTQIGAKLLRKREAVAGDVAPFEEYFTRYTSLMRVVAFRYVLKPGLRDRLHIPAGNTDSGIFYSWLGFGSGSDSTIAGLYIDGNRIEIFCYASDEDLPANQLDLIPWARRLKGHRPVESWFLNMIEVLQEGGLDEFVPPFKIPPFYWLHYDNVPNLPSNFVACGDAVMCLNPRWGQGLTKTTIDALTLDGILRKLPSTSRPCIDDNFSKRYFRLQAKRISGVWNGAKSVDYGIRGFTPAKGETLEKGKFAREFNMLLLQLAAEGDEQVAFAFWATRCFLAPQIDLFHPMIVFKALMLKLRIMIGLAKSIDIDT